MSIQFAEAPVAAPPEVGASRVGAFEAWELDVSIVESGPAADRLIRMTDDGCGSTCESACPATCP